MEEKSAPRHEAYVVHPLRRGDHDVEHFRTWEEATEHAVEESIDDDIWGVWTEGGDLMAIAYGSTLYVED